MYYEHCNYGSIPFTVFGMGEIGEKLERERERERWLRKTSLLWFVMKRNEKERKKVGPTRFLFLHIPAEKE